MFLGVTWTKAGSLRNSRGQAADLRREGGGEKQVLALRGEQREDLADVGDEAHVEHAIGLVEDEDLDPGEVDRALRDVVEQPAGRRDDDRRALTQAADLAVRSRRRRRWRPTGPGAADLAFGRSAPPGARAHGWG